MKSTGIALYILSILFISTINLLAQSDYKIAEQDSLALVAFYNATDGPNWTSNQDGFGFDNLSSEWQGVYNGGYNKWLEGPVKDWFGVTVEKVQNPNSNESSYRVVKLWPVIGRRTDGQNQLKGYIPREVGLLTALKEFMVNGNNGFENTEIPDDIYQNTLEVIDVEAAYFDGDVSDAFRNCVNLKKPNFRYNSFDYFPSINFLDEETLNGLESSFFLYNTEIPLSNFERIIDHFYSISDVPKRYGIQMRDANNVGDEIEIVAPVGTSVEMECVFAGEQEEFITYQWYKGGLSRFGKTQRFYSITSVKESDYGDYTVKITNDYVKNYDGNSNWGEVYTKPIRLVSAPVAPVVKWATTSYNGKELHLRLSKPMPEAISGFSGFSVQAGSKTVQVKSARTEGRLNRNVFLELEECIETGEVVSLTYAGSEVADKNGGLLEAFSAMEVDNLVRLAPAFVDARTTKDGSGIEIEFDNFIDAASIDINDFSIQADNNYSIVSGVLQKGDINEHISKVVLLTLSKNINDDQEQIKVSYSKGELAGLYSGCSQGFNDVSVNNLVVQNRTAVKLTVEDGKGTITNLVVRGTWGLQAAQLYDDGTNGDEIAGDKIWTAQLNLVDNNYVWDVYARETFQSYDTVSITDPVTGIITQTITPVTVNKDSILSNIVVLEFVISNSTVSGITTYGVATSTIVFNLTINNLEDQPYLMGIDGDWVNGIVLEQVGNSNIYTTTLSGYGIGDEISYNFRDGNNWENQTAETRTYTVKPGENIINNSFGVFTHANDIRQNSILVYPNPFQNQLNITGVPAFSKLDIYSLTGKLVSSKIIDTNELYLDVSNLKSGIYFIRISSDNKQIITKKIIKNN